MKNNIVYIIDGVRTPFLKAKNRPGPFRASDLGVMAMRDLLIKTNVDIESIDEAIVGCVASRAEEANIARYISVRAGCSTNMPSWTVGRNCGSGMQAIDSACSQIILKKSDIVIAGGVDALSRTHMIMQDSFVNVFAKFMAARSVVSKLKALSSLRLKMLSPVSALVKGLSDPLVDLSMGHTAENLVEKFAISREEQDQFAVRSHQRLYQAIDEGLLHGVIPIADNNGNLYISDNGVRRDSSMESLAKLHPYFDKKFGSVTAGNSSQITDGGVMLMLASEEAVHKYNLVPKAKIIDTRWSGLDPKIMGLGPAYAIAKLLTKNNISIDDVDFWEINEAFAAQVIACLKAMDDEEFCAQELGISRRLGSISEDKLNIYGGAISCGHPLGASGARIVLHLLSALENNKGKIGVASQCIGGGQGGAMLIEKI